LASFLKGLFGGAPEKSKRTEPVLGNMRAQADSNRASPAQSQNKQLWDYDRFGRDVVSASHRNLVIAVLRASPSYYVDWLAHTLHLAAAAAGSRLSVAEIELQSGAPLASQLANEGWPVDAVVTAIAILGGRLVGQLAGIVPESGAKRFLEWALMYQYVQAPPQGSATVPLGTRCTAVVTEIGTDHLWVRLGTGLEAVVPAQELAWTNKVFRPADLFRPAQPIEVVIANWAGTSPFLVASVRVAQEHPWFSFRGRTSVGDIVEGIVTGTADHIVELTLADGVTGLCFWSEISWTEPPVEAIAKVTIGDTHRARVTAFDDKERYCNLSLRKVLPNPAWDRFAASHSPGGDVAGVVVATTPEGHVHAWLEPGVIGIAVADDFVVPGTDGTATWTFEPGERIQGRILELRPEEYAVWFRYIPAKEDVAKGAAAAAFLAARGGIQGTGQVAQSEPAYPPTPEGRAAVLRSAIAELDAMIGLASVKAQVHSLVDLARAQKRRREAGLPVQPVALHLVFTGNPGTGKTTVARLIGRIYAGLGLLEGGHIIETDRGGLVGGFIGQTAIKTREQLDRAEGGVLFIDEAYSLASDASNDFGHEAIATLLKEMEDRRDRLAVVVAGYSGPMRKFLASNPGLQSRFTREVEFPDYDSAELLSVFEGVAKARGMLLGEETRERATDVIARMLANRDQSFGNAREIRTLFERTEERQATRLAADPHADIRVVLPADLPDPRAATARGNLAAALAKLDALVGLESVKEEIRGLIHLVTAQERRRRAGLPVSPVSLHLEFRGNPGTGKTTVARTIGEIYAALGLLPKGHVVETDRSGLVASYVGQTPSKVLDRVREALDGVLFVDEAYSLAARAEWDYGQEAIETLLKQMEDKRDRLAVIVSGYPGPMREFMAANPGLRSRFTRQINFPDYSAAELLQIFTNLCRREGMSLALGAADAAKTAIERRLADRGGDESFGNARDVRTLFERTMTRQARRLAMHPLADPTQVTAFDIPRSTEDRS
jgi:SpoVK/Ycf46/Vps4 family AAA+-type ATPase/predicted RNA-binding protein with RPS1 domain